MDFGLSDEQQAIKEVAARFGRERLAPYYMQRERQNGLDRTLLREMAGLGFMGMGVSAERGGMALDCVTRGIVTEEIAYHDFNVAYLMLLGSLMGELLCEHAQPEVVEEWLPRVVAGEALVALGLTEPRGGSDAANLQLKAERQGDEYVLSGEKTSITFSDQADLIILFARTGKPEQGARGVSAFLVPLNLPGISRTRFNDVGTKLIGRGSVFFDQVRIPAVNRMGDEGRGFVQVMQAFDFSRILLGLQCLGAAQASLDEAWAYTKERQAFGAPIAQYQGVTFPLAEADTLMSAARTLCYRGLWLRDQRLPHTAEAAMCKWWPPKLAYEVIHQCLLTHGHYGYTMDLPHQQRMRDVLGLQIGDGTAQIMKLVIARERVGRVAVQYAG